MNEQFIKSRKKPVISLIMITAIMVAVPAYFLVTEAMYSLFGETAVAKVTHKKQEWRKEGKGPGTFGVVVVDFSFQEASGTQRHGRDEADLNRLTGHEDTVIVEYVPGLKYASRLTRDWNMLLPMALLTMLFLVVSSIFPVLHIIHNSSLSKGLEPLAKGDAPKFSSDALVCRYAGWMNKPVSIIVDNSAGTLHLQNCHYPRAFPPKKAQPWYSCRLEELREVYVFKHHGDWLQIVTPSGSASILPDPTDFKSLCDQLPLKR